MSNFVLGLLPNQSVLYPGWPLPTLSTLTSTSKHTKPQITSTMRMTQKPPMEGEGGGEMPTTTEQSSDVWVLDLTWDDATWILTASFIIFTMQTGFGMLESGCVSVKNEANIMMKNVVDVVFGGFTYWLFGFSLTFGAGMLKIN
ncbi:putative ammonium transporter 3 [Orchesella cincta]|uniref:Putative ammonium transporter 3 n=1 Tax=Orchesella cincta TaxID=48709 RepID=A0A1D2MN88_ORCCI|nr:putative ammonium transporter 3 [Orchesella cincta]